jgi:hypothetical protein
METNINDEIAAYDGLRESLEADHTGEWVLIHDQKLISLFESFEEAAGAAVEQFGRGPYLIRQVGAPPVVLPASIMYPVPAPPINGSVHGQNEVRIR